MVIQRKTRRSWRSVLYGFGLSSALILSVSCSVMWLGQFSWEPPVLVSVEGDKGFAVVDWHGWRTFYPVQKDRNVSFPVRNNDLLFTPDSTFVLYQSADGRSLQFSGDEARAIINGSTVSLNLGKDNGWKWIKTATPEELKKLHLIILDEKLKPDQFSQLQRVAKANPDVGLLVDENGAWGEIAGMFDPVLLIINGLQKQDRDIILKKKNIHYLRLDNPDLDLEFLVKMPGLQTLIIDDWDPKKTGPLPDNLPYIKRIVLNKSAIVNLESLGRQPGLLELNIQEGTKLNDLSFLKEFPLLRLLSLHYLDKKPDPKPLNDLKRLKWLSLPSNTTQEQFIEIIQNLPDLVFLDLSGCQKLTDLTPVQQLPNLRYLMVDGSSTENDFLYGMKHLKWLAATGKKGEVKESDIKKLQEILPNTDFALLTPFCLGSGWILLALPVIALCWRIARRRERMHPAAPGHHG